MKRVKSWILAAIFAFGIGGAGTAVISPQSVSAAACEAAPSFLGFPTWYRGLEKNTVTADEKQNCSIKSPSEAGGIQGFVVRISLNILDILLRLVGFLAVGFVIFGGFKYITSTGSTDGMAKAKSTIMNALIGLGLSIVSVGIVNAVASSIDGNTATKDGVNLPTQNADTVLQGVLGAVYFWGGIACVIVIVIAGFYYVTSQGNAAQVARAKTAIIAAIVGLTVIIMAFAITQFVIGGII